MHGRVWAPKRRDDIEDFGVHERIRNPEVVARVTKRLRLVWEAQLNARDTIGVRISKEFVKRDFKFRAIGLLERFAKFLRGVGNEGVQPKSLSTT